METNFEFENFDAFDRWIVADQLLFEERCFDRQVTESNGSMRTDVVTLALLRARGSPF